MRVLVAELIGTFFLTLTVAFTSNPLAVGVVLMIVIYSLGWISGAHFNPAITIAMLVKKDMKLNLGIKYILAQFIGSLLAASIYYVVYNNAFTPTMNVNTTLISALIMEVLFTALLVFAFYSVGINKKLVNNQYFGVVIGLVLFVGGTVAAGISGGVFNPAVGVAPLFLNVNELSLNLNNILLYTLGPILGGIIGMVVFQYLDAEK